MAKINYKGEEKEIQINNRTMMKFEQMGGTLQDFEDKPVTSSIILACASLDLQGDPLDHANDLPSLNELSEIMKEALVESGYSDEDVGNENG